jgi:hypothetical protein
MDHDDDRELSRRVAEAYPRVGPLDETAKARIMERVRDLRGEPATVVPLDAAPRREPATVVPLDVAPRRNGRRPAIGFAVAASLVLGTLLGWVLHDRVGTPRSAVAPAPGMADIPSTREVRLVQFVLTAPQASHVVVVGDFNEWDPAATPLVRREGGAWTAAIPVAPGRHVYAFIVDGDRWVSDPAAPLAPEDGFGIRNSVIVVGQEST